MIVRRMLGTILAGFRLAMIAMVLTCYTVASTPAFAQAAPAYRGTINQSVAKVVSYNAQRRGFAANDPRVAATTAAMGGVATTVAVGVGAAVVTGTAIAWGPILATAVVGTLVSIGIGYGIDWLFGADGKVTVGENSNPTLGILGPGNAFREARFGCMAGSGAGIGQCYAQQLLATTYKNYVEKPGISYTNVTVNSGGNGGNVTVVIGPSKFSANASTTPGSNAGVAFSRITYTSTSCDSGMATGTASSGTCLAMANTTGTPDQQQKTVEDAIRAMSDADKARDLNPAIIAAAANKLWQDAAMQPGYAGLPFSASDPVTNADAQAVRNAEPSTWPKVQDALQPVSSGAVAPSVPPVKIPDSTQPNAPAQNPGTNPATGELVNLGPDPGIGSPAQEAEPDAGSLFDAFEPVLDGVKNFTASSVPTSNVCPTYDLSVMGMEGKVEAHCVLFENNRAAISAIFIMAFTIMALLTLLRA